jgi:hypothetical protein
MNEETADGPLKIILLTEPKRGEKNSKPSQILHLNEWLIDQLISTEVISSVEIASAAGEISSEDKSYIENFFYNYNTASADAINTGNFYYVEPFINYDGQFYDEQLNFVNDVYSKGIGEEHLSTELESVEIVNDEIWRVTTIEKFIINGTQRSSEKTFRTITNLKLIGGEVNR